MNKAEGVCSTFGFDILQFVAYVFFGEFLKPPSWKLVLGKESRVLASGILIWDTSTGDLS